MPIEINGASLRAVQYQGRDIERIYNASRTLVWVKPIREERVALQTGEWRLPSKAKRVVALLVSHGGSKGADGRDGVDVPRRYVITGSTTTRYRVKVQDGTRDCNCQNEEVCIGGQWYHPSRSHSRGRFCTGRIDTVRRCSQCPKYKRVWRSRTDYTYGWTTPQPGGDGGAGGAGGHGMHLLINEEVDPNDSIEVEVKANGAVKILHGTTWTFEIPSAGNGGAGGAGGRGNADGADGASGQAVTIDGVRYAGGEGQQNSGHDGGAGGQGASGIQIASAAADTYQVWRGHLSGEFTRVATGSDGYSIAGRILDFAGNSVMVSARGRGQTATQSATAGFVYVVALG